MCASYLRSCRKPVHDGHGLPWRSNGAAVLVALSAHHEESLTEEQIREGLVTSDLRMATLCPLRLLRAAVLVWKMNGRRQPRTGYNIGSLENVEPWSDQHIALCIPA